MAELQKLIDQCKAEDVEPFIMTGEPEVVLLRHRPTGGLSFLLVEDDDLNSQLVTHLKASGARCLRPDDMQAGAVTAIEDEA